MVGRLAHNVEDTLVGMDPDIVWGMARRNVEDMVGTQDDIHHILGRKVLAGIH